MIQEIAPKYFDNNFKKEEAREDDIVFVFKGNGRRTDRVLARSEEGMLSLPRVKDLEKMCVMKEELQYLFSIDEERFFLYRNFSLEDLLQDQFDWENIFIFRKNEPQYLGFAGMTAYHLFVWYRDAQYCGRCGKKLVHDQKERMMRCECGNMVFPKIAPAVIIGLRNGDQIMMSRYAGREYKGRALLAGFCEIGETPEETVVREVLEEVGLHVKNVSYFGSQPWGFDSNLLLGYYCDLDGDTDIRIDENELASAGFVKRDEIEYDPNLLSLTATMIETFRLGKDRE